MNKDINSNIALCNILDPVAITATTTSDIVDTKGFEALTILVQMGAGTFTTANSTTFKLQESDTVVGTAFTTVSSANMIGSFSVVDGTNADENSVQKVGYIGNKRYVRLVATEAGTVSSVISAVAVLSHARKEVASNISPTSAT